MKNANCLTALTNTLSLQGKRCARDTFRPLALSALLLPRNIFQRNHKSLTQDVRGPAPLRNSNSFTASHREQKGQRGKLERKKRKLVSLSLSVSVSLSFWWTHRHFNTNIFITSGQLMSWLLCQPLKSTPHMLHKQPSCYLMPVKATPVILAL